MKHACMHVRTHTHTPLKEKKFSLALSIKHHNKSLLVLSSAVARTIWLLFRAILWQKSMDPGDGPWHCRVNHG